MGYFVQVKWVGRSETQIASGVRYISHREESLRGGRTRELYGIGDRYRELRGDEPAIVRRLWDDGAGLREPRYYRGKLTVDDDTAARLSRLPPDTQERVLRDAVDGTFRGAARRAQGVFVIHTHGGRDRPSGHPHAHFRLSPLLDNGHRMIFTPRRLEMFKERWHREVNRNLDRALAREDRPRQPANPDRSRGDRDRQPAAEREEKTKAPRPERKSSITERGLRLLGMGPARAAVRELAPAVAGASQLKDTAKQAIRDPGRAITQAAFRLATRALPAPFRTGLGIARIFGRLRQDR